MQVRIPKHPSIALAEETGLHLGDGTMNYYRQRNKIKGKYCLRGHIVDDRPHYETRIRELYYDLYGLTVPNSEFPTTGVYGFQLWNEDLVKFKSQVLNLPLGWKTNCVIPSVFLGDTRFELAVLRGIFDTDGNIYVEDKRGKPYLRAKFSNTSQPLMTQIQTLLLSFEVRATLHKHVRENPKWNDLYDVEIRGEQMVTKLFSLVKPANNKHIVKYGDYFLS